MNSESLFQRFASIQREWGLTHDQMAGLLHVERDRYEAWLASAADPRLPTIPPGAESGAPLVAIHRRLSEKLPDTEQQVRWLTTAHPDFDGHKPYDIAVSSAENLAWLAYYLESALTLSKDVK
jgi:hypothetical protein